MSATAGTESAAPATAPKITVEPARAPRPPRTARAQQTKGTTAAKQQPKGSGKPAPDKADKPEPRHPEGPAVLPLRGKSDPKDEQGDYVIARVVDSPWIAANPGVVRLVRGLKAPVKKRVHLYHAKGDHHWMGEWEVIAKHDGKLPVWQVQAGS
jgi:hypothetical protein